MKQVENDATEMIRTLIEPDDIMDHLLKHNHVDYPSETDDYGENCYNMCNIFTYVIGLKLQLFTEPNSIIVHEGVFGMVGNHTWIEIEDIIVDATAKQFYPEAEKLSLVHKDTDVYQSVKQYPFEEWIEQSENVA